MSTLEMVLSASFVLAMGALIVGACCCLIRPDRQGESDVALLKADQTEYVAEAAHGCQVASGDF